MTCRLSKSVKWLLRWQPSAILYLWSTFWDDLQRVFGCLCHCAKFGWNHCSGFDTYKSLNILRVWLKKTYSCPQNGFFWGIWPPKWDAIWTRPQKALVCVETRHMTFVIRGGVRPLAVYRRAFSLPPALRSMRPRLVVKPSLGLAQCASPLTLGLVL